MIKYTLCGVVLLLAITSANVIAFDQTSVSTKTLLPTTLPICNSLYEYPTPSGCWKSCDSPTFNNCPEIFPQNYNPSFCAYTQDGKYVNYTYECQACKNTNEVAVRDGACSCDFLKCNKGEVCSNGQCIPQAKPCIYACIFGTICQNGECVQDPNFNPCSVVKCTATTTCVNGQCVPIEKPCKYACVTGTVCQNGECVQDPNYNPCAVVRCRSGTVCINGDCVPQHPIDPIDPCALVKCRAGTVCVNGDCVPQHPIDPIDPCSVVRCRSGTVCINGDCVPIDPCSNVTCCDWQQCQNGKCVQLLDKCAVVRCMAGYNCFNGNCIPNGLCSGVVCKPGYTCRNGYCVRNLITIDPCKVLRCLPGQICLDGGCTDACALIRCIEGYECKLGNCIPRKGLCGINVCSPDQFCINGKCVCLSGNGCNAKKTVCTAPRPNQKTCPTKYYFVAPQPTVCGISFDGSQVGYPQTCDACKDTSIQYFYDKPCDQLLNCDTQPTPVSCSCDQNCPDGFRCDSGKCVDKCYMVKCWAGSHCVKGACVADYTPVDSSCAAVLCVTNTRCQNGKCIPL